MRTRTAVVVCAWVILLCSVHANNPDYPNCHGDANTLGVYEHPPTLSRSTKTGKLYMTGGDDNPLYVLHMYGSPYQMGLAHGQLMKEELTDMLQLFTVYMEQQVEQNAAFLERIPPHLRKIIEDDGIEAALAYEVLRTEPYVKKYFVDEMKGLADGAGLSYEHIRRINMFPELIKAACSIMGAWGNATETGGLLHLRALDWGTDNPFRKYPTLFVYHPLEPISSHPFVSLGWIGLVGALTGYSQYVAAGEKVFGEYTGAEVRGGAPWNFVFRDMLQFSESVDEAIELLQNTQRTCAIYLGIGDHKNAGNESFKVVEYTHDFVHVFEDLSPFPGFAPTSPAHPLLPHVVYVDKHSQPSKDYCMSDILTKNYGKINVDTIISLTSIFQTGDMHAAIFDYSNDLIYVSLAAQHTINKETAAPAYDRQYIQLDVKALFNN